jgi:hypothetical protein
MTNNELIAAQDSQRTQRNFIALLSGAFGTDHSMANEDGFAINQPGGYQTMGYNGAVGVEGQPISNLQGGGGLVITLPFLLICGVAFLLLKD